MTKDELKTLFIDFWPALKCWGDQEIEDDKLIDCWSRHISGEPYTLPEWIDSTVTIPPKTMTPIKNLQSAGIAPPIVFDLDW